MGFSLGGFVSQMIVAKEPALVRRMILAGTGPAGGAGVGEITPTLLGDTLRGLFTLRPEALPLLQETSPGIVPQVLKFLR
jgi:pimeloyl-ACP methyl ester carboxylesterase